MTKEEIIEKGGYLGSQRNIKFTLCYPNKEPFIYFTTRMDRNSSEADLALLVSNFIKLHFPDGTPVPEIHEIEWGQLEWRMDL